MTTTAESGGDRTGIGLDLVEEDCERFIMWFTMNPRERPMLEVYVANVDVAVVHIGTREEEESLSYVTTCEVDQIRVA